MSLALRVTGPVAITYLLTWGVLMTGILLRWNTTLLGTLVMWVPGVIALIAAKVLKVRLPIFGIRHLFTAPLWAIALVLGVCLLSLPFATPAKETWETMMVALKIPVQGGVAFVLGLLFFTLVSYVAGLTINLVAALGEELMWRGLLWEQLKGLGFVPASLTIGAIWGFWHAPMVWLIGLNYPSTPLWIGLAMMLLVCLTLSPILCYLRARGDSILVPAAFHGTINAISGVAFLLFAAPNPLIVGMTGIPGIILSAGVSVYCILKCRQRQETC